VRLRGFLNCVVFLAAATVYALVVLPVTALVRWLRPEAR